MVVVGVGTMYGERGLLIPSPPFGEYLFAISRGGAAQLYGVSELTYSFDRDGVYYRRTDSKVVCNNILQPQ